MSFSNSPLSPATVQLIETDIIAGTTTSQICATYNTTRSTIALYRRNLSVFGACRPTRMARMGRPSKLGPEARDGILEYLLSNKQAYIDEVQAFVEDEFDITVSYSAIQKAMAAANLTRKVVEREAQQRNEILRTRFISQVAQYTTEQLVFVDESAANERTAERKWGWSMRGDPCRVKRDNKRSKRWSILPAITVDGYIAVEIYQDSFTKRRFNHFIRHDLLPVMQPYPLPCSVLIMDNHLIHRSDELTEMCEARGVIILYLPPYSPDLNPIEQSFAQLKAWMRRNQRLADLLNGQFEAFIRLAIRSTMGERGAWGHFRACGYGGGPGDDLDDDTE